VPIGGSVRDPVDLEPATRLMADLVGGIPDELLGGPTPCPAYTLGDLLDHISGTALAFTAAASKAGGDIASHRASGDASRLGDGWRSRIAGELAALAAAWRDPAAWTGTTRAGGVDMPGEVAGLVVLDELVVHGWDVARASEQPYDADPDVLGAVHGFLTGLTRPEQEAMRRDIFGPVVAVPDDAPLLDRLVGLAGRDPTWRPPRR
jgi:uncharacterized protein (TIGR03086 family)